MKIYFTIILLFISNLVFAQQWQLAKGTEGFAAADIDIYYSDPDTMYAIGFWLDRSGGMLISTDAGETWQRTKGPETDVGAIKVDPFDSKRIYVSVYGRDDESNDIWMTTDGGETWDTLFYGRGYPVPIVEIDPVDLRTVYVGVGPSSIRRSIDRGETWESVITPPTPSPNFLNALAIAPSNDSVLYLAYVSGLFKSTDKGNSWTQLPLKPGYWGISCIAVDPNNTDVVYAAVYSRGLPPGGIFKSTDGGLTWEEKNNGLDSTNWDISSLLIEPEKSETVFVGAYTTKGTVDTIGVFRTTDGANSWKPFDDGIPGGISVLIFDNIHNRLFGGAIGIYFTDSVITSIEKYTTTIPKKFILYQNYPNPFNGTTIIKYELPKRAFVNLALYDVLGRKVKTIINENKEPGKYKSKLEGGDLSSGIYFYRLQSGSFISTKKMLLLK